MLGFRRCMVCCGVEMPFFVIRLQDFDVDEAMAVEQSLLGPPSPRTSATSQLESRKVRFEVDLQDDLIIKYPILLARLKSLSNAARLAASAEAVEFWEGRLNEIEFIAETTGKRAALAFAKSFYSGKSGFSTAHLIELNKRAKLCYRATKRHHSSTGSEDQSSSDFKARKQHHGKIWQKPPSFTRPRQESSQFSKGTTCFKCGEEGHVAYHCPSRKFGQRKFVPKRPFPFKEKKCFICEETSHLTAQCHLNPMSTHAKKEK